MIRLIRVIRLTSLIMTIAIILSTIFPKIFVNVSATSNLKKKGDTSSFGVGKGINWPSSVVAPYVDMTSWTETEFATNGVIQLDKISNETGIKFFNLGFIQGISASDEEIKWGWGSFLELSEEGNSNLQYKFIKKSIENLRKQGGDVAVSFGGANQGAFWSLTQDVDVLAKTYIDIINGYGLTRIDLDVEGIYMNIKQNIANAQAIKKVQEETGVQVVLTLPVMDYGLTKLGLDVLKTYLSEGVKLDIVNLMTMNYGVSVKDYAVGSINAVDNTAIQLQGVYSEVFEETLEIEKAYGLLGTTPSIKFESVDHPYFTTNMKEKIIDHANKKGIGMVSFWAINRDARLNIENSQGEDLFDYSNIASNFFSDDISGDISDSEKTKKIDASVGEDANNSDALKGNNNQFTSNSNNNIIDGKIGGRTTQKDFPKTGYGEVNVIYVMLIFVGSVFVIVKSGGKRGIKK